LDFTDENMKAIKRYNRKNKDKPSSSPAKIPETDASEI
jgi:hypothetical protein